MEGSRNSRLGSVTSLTDASGQIAASYTYDSFGKLTASTGTVTNPFRYTGREYDSTTGLYFYRARYYDSDVGRFISEDPIGFGAGGTNFFAYVVNDPTGLVDPTGEEPCLNVDNFLKSMDDYAHGKTKSGGKCAKAVRLGLHAGGLDTSGHPAAAKDYGPFLRKLGFSQISDADGLPRRGDVMVFQPGPSQWGHVQVWDGHHWISDYVQSTNTGVYPGTHYRDAKAPHSLYRYSEPCP